MTHDYKKSSERLVLTLNAGSSSLKFAVFASVAPREPARRIASGLVDRIGQADATVTITLGEAPASTRTIDAPDHERAFVAVMGTIAALGGFTRVAAVGHRIVHGGRKYDRASLVAPEVIAELRSLAPLDPQHLPAEIALIHTVHSVASALPQVACFDTAFHRSMPRVARLLPVPRRYEALGVERYGFHGLSYTYLIEELARVAGKDAACGKVVLAHLGAGASLCAALGGRSIDTTMGFTPTSGIPMGTRTGDIDPGFLLWLMREQHMNEKAIDALVNQRSGLLGVSETSSDMRDLLAREATDPRAADAVALFCYAAKKAVGALVATLGGVGTLVFSGGIGEHAAPIRARIASGLEHLGIHLDSARNAEGAPVISSDGSACTVRVIPTDEESVVARQTREVLEHLESQGDLK